MQIEIAPCQASEAVDRQASAALRVVTRGRGMLDLTPTLLRWLEGLAVGDGVLTLFCRHTSASLTVQENADPRVQADLLDALDRLAPAGAGWRHDEEGPDDMPAHVKASLTDASLSIPVARGRLLLGTWQAVYLVEHRQRPHRRDLRLHYLGS